MVGFHKSSQMVGFSCGKQHSIHGPAVIVPTDLMSVCSVYPSPKASISNPDGSSEAKEEVMLQDALHV